MKFRPRDLRRKISGRIQGRELPDKVGEKVQPRDVTQRIIARPLQRAASSPVVELRTEPAATAARRRDLEEYYEGSVLGSSGFVCSSAPSCGASVAKPDISFYEGQLPYLGPHYDTMIGESPMRVLVVPMEVGRDWVHTSMEHFSEIIRWRASQQFGERNPHMRGVTLALRMAFGLDVSDDPGGEYLHTPHGKIHVLDAYAMVNAVLCSAVNTGTTKSRQSGVMRRNCSRHLTAAIRILEPSLVISQGAQVGKHLATVFRVRRQHSATVATCSLSGVDFQWVNLAHPTAYAPLSWNRPSHLYLRETVEPSIALARQVVLGSDRS